MMPKWPIFPTIAIRFFKSTSYRPYPRKNWPFWRHCFQFNASFSKTLYCTLLCYVTLEEAFEDLLQHEGRKWSKAEIVLRNLWTSPMFYIACKFFKFQTYF